MSFSIFDEVFGRRQAIRMETDRYGSVKADVAEAAAEALAAVQTVVDAFTDHKGGRFIVGFSHKAEAYTALGQRRLVVSSAPLFDRKLSRRKAVEVMTGLVCHEVGHVLHSIPMGKAVSAKWPGFTLAQKVSNLLDDVRLEDRMARDYPGVAATFRPTLRWVAGAHKQTTPWQWKRQRKLVDRFNFAITATRYAFVARWVGDDETRENRAWWEAWALKYSADDTVELHLAGVEAAIVRLQTVVPDPLVSRATPYEPPPVIDEPNDDEEGYEGDGLADETDDEDEVDEEDLPEEEPEPEAPDCPDLPDKPESGPSGIEDEDSEPNPEPEGPVEDGPTVDTGNDINESEVEKTIDDLAEVAERDYNAQNLDAAVEEEAKQERIRSTNGFGTMKVRVEL